MIERLREKYELAIFTGRNIQEAEITLGREKMREHFLLMTSDDVEREKPHRMDCCVLQLCILGGS